MRFLVRASHDGTRSNEDVRGPFDRDAIVAMVDGGDLSWEHLACPESEAFWAPLGAWAALALEVPPPDGDLREVATDAPKTWLNLAPQVRDALRWWLLDGDDVRGPLSTETLLEELDEQVDEDDPRLVTMVGESAWYPVETLARRDSWRALASSEVPGSLCDVCLERIPADSHTCPECGERVAPASSIRAASIPDAADTQSLLRQHWRPLLTGVVLTGLLSSGVVLRHVAPARYEPPQDSLAPAAPAEPRCEEACWRDEACQVGRCVWAPSNEVGHIDPEALTISGPFSLPAEVSDVLPLDTDRFAVASLRGVYIQNARTGSPISLVSDAPHAQQLYRIGEVVYATAPHRIYVIDVASTEVRKTVEVGHAVADIAVGASGQRVLASMPGGKAVAVISTDYHAEVARFHFGDDHVGPVAFDDSGELALTTNGQIPLAGLRASREATRYGAMYAFDPERLPSEQDRVRTGFVGNPADVAIAPDEARTSYVLLREEDTVVKLERQPNGALRQSARWKTCRQPEEIEIVQRGRRAIVRCNMGKAIEIFSLEPTSQGPTNVAAHKDDAKAARLLKHIPLAERVSDMKVSPDGEQVMLALSRDGDNAGALAIVDLDDGEVKQFDLGGTPHQIRVTPDGRTAVVLSERSKVAWVIR